MNDETKKVIEELKTIMLDMYRNASDLDQWIQQVERLMGDETIDPELLNLHIKTLLSYRMDIKLNRSYDTLDQRELIVWKKLILSTDPNRETEEQES